MDLKARISSALYSRVKSRSNLRRVALPAASALQRVAVMGRRLRHPTYRAARVAGIAKSAEEWAEPGKPSTGTRSRTRIVYGLPGYEVRNQLPSSVDHRYDAQYQPLVTRVPPSFVLEMAPGRLAGDGVVIGPDDRIIHQVSRAIGSLKSYVMGAPDTEVAHLDVSRQLAAPPRRLSGMTVVLSTFAGRGYYHWLYDVIARLATLEDAGISRAEPDHFVVNNFTAGYQVETLTRLGIDRRRVVTSFRNPHILAEHLIVPSLARENGVNPLRTCEFLRSSFPGEPVPAPLSSASRIYISRAGTDHGRLVNEGSALNELKRRGFVPVLLEELSMGEKATLFSRAEVIVGASGAGLTNLVFCAPGTIVVDICTRGYALLDAWDIANRVGVDYWYSPDTLKELLGALDAAGIT